MGVTLERATGVSAVEVASVEDTKADVRRVLEQAGLSAQELLREAKKDRFSSAAAEHAWFLVGGLLPYLDL